MRQHSDKKIIRIWFQEVFSKGNTDILKEIASDDVITHFQGNDEGP